MKWEIISIVTFQLLALFWNTIIVIHLTKEYKCIINSNFEHRLKWLVFALKKVQSTLMCMALLMPRHLVWIAYGTQLVIPGCRAVVANHCPARRWWNCCWRVALCLSAVTFQNSYAFPVVHVVRWKNMQIIYINCSVTGNNYSIFGHNIIL